MMGHYDLSEISPKIPFLLKMSSFGQICSNKTFCSMMCHNRHINLILVNFLPPENLFYDKLEFGPKFAHIYATSYHIIRLNNFLKIFLRDVWRKLPKFTQIILN